MRRRGNVLIPGNSSTLRDSAQMYRLRTNRKLKVLLLKLSMMRSAMNRSFSSHVEVAPPQTILQSLQPTPTAGRLVNDANEYPSCSDCARSYLLPRPLSEMRSQLQVRAYDLRLEKKVYLSQGRKQLVVGGSVGNPSFGRSVLDSIEA